MGPITTTIRCTACCLTVLCFVGLAAAGQGTRSVTGVVSDQDGHPVKGAVVQIEDTRTLSIRSCISNGRGEYRFFGLSREVNYELHATYKDVSSKVKRLSVFDEERLTVIHFEIGLKTVPADMP